MPLVKSSSPKAFRANVKAEVVAGKPVKQAVAIAYSVKREAAKPAPMKKKYSGRLHRHSRRWCGIHWRRSKRHRIKHLGNGTQPLGHGDLGVVRVTRR